MSDSTDKTKRRFGRDFVGAWFLMLTGGASAVWMMIDECLGYVREGKVEKLPYWLFAYLSVIAAAWLFNRERAQESPSSKRSWRTKDRRPHLRAFKPSATKPIGFTKRAYSLAMRKLRRIWPSTSANSLRPCKRSPCRHKQRACTWKSSKRSARNLKRTPWNIRPRSAPSSPCSTSGRCRTFLPSGRNEPSQINRVRGRANDRHPPANRPHSRSSAT